MVDYERYDHTYCRILKEGEDITNRKRKLSSASYEKALDTENSQTPTVSFSYGGTTTVLVPPKEKENDLSTKREPVIIVRTKRPRKTAPCVNTLETCKPQSYNTVSVQKEEAAAANAALTNNDHNHYNKSLEATVSDNTKESKVKKVGNKKSPGKKQMGSTKPRQTQKKISNSPSVEQKHAPGEEVKPQVTQSGRVRKPTTKVKENASNNSNDSPSKRKVSANRQSASGAKRAKIELEDKAEQLESADGEKTSKTSADEVKDGGKPLNEKTSAKKKKEKPVRNVKRGVKKQEPAKKPTRKRKTPTKESTNKKPSTSKSPKQKLIVVTRPPPNKRSAKTEPSATKTKPATGKGRKGKEAVNKTPPAVESIPAANIDASNILSSSRRKK